MGPVGAASASHTCAGGAHTRLSDATLLCWTPELADGERVAIDAEYSSQPVPATLAARFGSDGFWTRWTRVEVCCKLADIPILVWLDDRGLADDPALDLLTRPAGPLTVTFGLATPLTPGVCVPPEGDLRAGIRQ